MTFACRVNGYLSTFNPVLRVYTTGTAASETIPAGATYMTIEAWGTGGQGGSGTGGIESPQFGYGGGAGGYSRVTINVSNSNLKTVLYTVGQVPDSASSVSSGTLSLSTIVANSGADGSTGAPGSGGTATNSNSGAVNTTGASGSSTAPGGGAGTSGVVVGDGSPYGGGGRGGNGAANTGRGLGGTAAVVFSYQ